MSRAPAAMAVGGGPPRRSRRARRRADSAPQRIGRNIPAFLGGWTPVPRPPGSAAPSTTELLAGLLAEAAPAGLAAGSAALADGREVVSGFSVEDQDIGKWCWAALTLGLIRKYGGHPEQRQCDVATRVFEEPCCVPDKSRFNRPVPLGGVLSKFGLLAGGVIVGEVDFGDVVREIGAQRPVCLRVHSRSMQDGHVIAISGYEIAGGTPYVQVHDPRDNGAQSNVAKRLPFETLKHRYFGEPTHWTQTYFTRPRP